LLLRQVGVRFRENLQGRTLALLVEKGQVALERRLVRLPVAQRRIAPGHLPQALVGEQALDERPLWPERAVVVEGRDAFLRRDVRVARGIGRARDKVEYGALGGRVVPRRQRVARRATER